MSVSPPNLLKQLSVVSALQKIPAIASKPVLASLDIDGTLIPWEKEPQHDEVALQRYSNFTHRPEFRKNTFMLLNTGRGLSSIQGIAPLLKKFPIDALGLNDGQQFFLRKPDEGSAIPQDSAEATEAWLKGLRPQDEDIEWKEQLQGWSTGEVMSTAQAELPKMGFTQKLKENQAPHEANEFTQAIPSEGKKKPASWIVKIHPDQSYFEVTRSDPYGKRERITEFANQIGSTMQSTLQSRWPNARYFINSTPKSAYVHIGPQGNSKASLATHILKSRFDIPPSAVISAGDSANDLESLSQSKIADIPNYPIMVGKHPVLIAALEHNPPAQLEKCEKSKLDEGLEKQFTKIKSAFPLLFGSKPASTKPKAVSYSRFNNH